MPYALPLMINPIKSLIEYIKTSIAEMRKVTWPTKDATIRYTAIIIVVTVALAASFAVLDIGFSKLITTVLTGENTPSQSTDATTEQPITPDLEVTDIEATGSTEEGNGEIKLNLDNVETAPAEETPAQE